MDFSAEKFRELSMDEESRMEGLGEASVESVKKAMDEEKKEDQESCLPVLPPEIIRHIVSFLDFDALNKMRLVSRDLNDFCRSLLIRKLLNLQSNAKAYLHEVMGGDINFDVALSILVCLAQVLAALIIESEDEKSRFDAGKVIEDAARLLDRVKSEEETSHLLEEFTPHSFILFRTFYEQHIATYKPFPYDSLNHYLS